MKRGSVDITISDIARDIGVNANSLRACIDRIPGLPEPVWLGQCRYYDRESYQNWLDTINAAGGDPVDVFREAYRQHQAVHRLGDCSVNPQILQLVKDFTSGRYMTDEQKVAVATRRSAAAANQNRQRVIQRIRPDWF